MLAVQTLETPVRPLHFLLVEDDDSHATLTMRCLRSDPVGHTVDRVEDGVEAMIYLRRQVHHFNARRPDMILLDLNLPRKSGHEVLSEIRQDKDLRMIPVVVLTTSAAEIDIARAFSYQANSYLTKPADFQRYRDMLLDTVRYWAKWNRLPQDAM
jgi:CheY-like chemotaxis protein